MWRMNGGLLETHNSSDAAGGEKILTLFLFEFNFTLNFYY